MKLTKEAIYKAEHDLIGEALSYICEYETAEPQVNAAFYAAGMRDMVHEIIHEILTP